MQHSFSYEKNKVIQGVRYHFVQDRGVKLLVILINVFAIVSAALFYSKKIRPEPFLLGSILWLVMMVTFWYIMPHSIYKKAATFKDTFTIDFADAQVTLSNARGSVHWGWEKFSKFFESPHFFHLYFDAKSFFIVPKEGMPDNMRHELRGLLNKKIGA
ncbi:MAG: YcxB family protein [Bacteroidetes bacterium]|jgi:YcxB-like protein|nr:YcxB family protein [Bacteroidota bacterium]